VRYYNIPVGTQTVFSATTVNQQDITDGQVWYVIPVGTTTYVSGATSSQDISNNPIFYVVPRP